MKKHLFLTLGLICFAGLFAADNMPELYFNPPPRYEKLDQKNIITLKAGNFEIVVPDDAGKPVQFAGKELKQFLGQIFAAEIPVRKTRSANVEHAIILGDSALSRKAGMKVDDLGRDAFRMKTIGKDIYIAGLDDKASNTEKLLNDRSWKTEPYLHQRATLFGVYDFLERFAGVRFYFLGPIGTIVPKAASLKIPSLNIFERPDCIVRSYQNRRWSKEFWYMDSDPLRDTNLHGYRVRLQTRSMPNCHGLAYMGYVARFGQSNPEFFALKKDGTRSNTWKDDYPGQLCLTNSAFRDEVFKDVVSGLKGEPPTKRGVVFAYKGNQKGISMWSPCALHYPGFFNVHLQDGMQACLCGPCQKYYRPDGRKTDSGELIWEFTADMANRVKKAGINAYITQMAYHFYREVPKIDLPDNVLVQVAIGGPWAVKSANMDKADRKLLADWHKKIGKKVWLWNYPINGPQYTNYNSPGVPHYSPLAFGRYYQDRRDDICGAFMQNSAQNDYIHEAMNIYVGLKVMWNTSLDYKALMAEYYTKMFQSAAPEMKKFFEELEVLWTTKMRGQFIETDLGPVSLKPTEYETWKQIYTPEKLAAWSKLFDNAEKKVAKDKDALARVRFMREHFLVTMQKYSSEFLAKEKRSNQLIAYAAPAGQEDVQYLSRMKGGKTEIKATVKVQNAGDALVFQFRSDDPKHAQLNFKSKKGDMEDYFAHTTFEIYLNPTKDRKTVYQVAVSPAGTLFTTQHPTNPKKWGAGVVKAETFVGKDHWTATVRIPLSTLPGLDKKGFPINFSYNRVLKSARNELYSWSPWLQIRFLEVDHYGQLSLEKPVFDNLVKDHDLKDLKKVGRIAGKYWRQSDPKFKNDFIGFSTEYFITGGQSYKIVGTDPKSNTLIMQSLTKVVKPDTKYRFSYYAKYDLEKEAVFSGTVWAGTNFFTPHHGSKGKRDWTLITREFKTNKKFDTSHVGFSLRGKGVVYIDHVTLQEIK